MDSTETVPRKADASIRHPTWPTVDGLYRGLSLWGTLSTTLLHLLQHKSLVIWLKMGPGCHVKALRPEAGASWQLPPTTILKNPGMRFLGSETHVIHHKRLRPAKSDQSESVTYLFVVTFN